MNQTRGAVLQGWERRLVHDRLRAAVGRRWELPRLLRRVPIPPGRRCLEIGTGPGWGTRGLLEQRPGIRVVATGL